jgi:hypothetical protein
VKLLIYLSLAILFQPNCKKIELNSANLMTPTPTPKQEKKNVMEKEVLAKKIEAIDENTAKIVGDAQTKIREIPVSFLQNGEIFVAEKFAPSRLIQIYIGKSDDSVFLIGGDAEKYYEFVEKAKLSLNNSETRIAYLKNFLQITEAGKGRFQIVESVDEIKIRPNLSDENKQKFAQFQEKFKSVIVAPKETSDFKYAVFAIIGQDLVKLNLTIKPDNKIERTDEILEKDLLIPYSL